MTFLEKLDSLIRNKGLNKHSFAKECGIPYTTIDYWYRQNTDKVKLDTLRLISEFFGVSLNYWKEDESSFFNVQQEKFSTFGNNIRRYREAKGMNQEELALALGYKTKGSVNKIEHNVTKLPQPKIKLCAEILGVPVSKLFEDSESKEDPFEKFEEYLPYLAQADPTTLRNIRAILGMPLKTGGK